MIERLCQQCGNYFFVYPSQACGKNGHKAIFCSRGCQAKARIGTRQSEETNRKKSVALSRKVEVICQNCGGKFLTKPSVIKRGSGKFCSMKCYAQFKRSQENWNWWRKGKSLPEEVKQKISASLIKSQIRKALWGDSTFVKTMMVARQAKPNGIEAKLIEILNQYVPQFKYNGDFSLGITLAGLIPDFVNINGKKEVIELFGDYWHSMNDIRWNYTELGRVMAYNAVGFKCLVIWEHELKELPEEELVSRIKLFFRRRKASAYHRFNG